MTNLNVVRSDVLAMHAYAVADSKGLIKLDAMENPYPLPTKLKEILARELVEIDFNRYPEPTYTQLKQLIQLHLDVPSELPVMVGNGSDELIALICQACAKPDAVIMAPLPSFVMYAISAQLNQVRFVGVPLQADFSLDLAATIEAIQTHQPSVVFLAYPNNPTGNLFDEDDVVAIIEAVGDRGWVVIDEAYQAFSEKSFAQKIPTYGNTILMRTVSKIGLAGIRLGYLAAQPEIVNELEKIRPPYNINALTERTACCVLPHVSELFEQTKRLCASRAALSESLSAISGLQVFPSQANFLLVRVPDANYLFEELLHRKILIKNVSKMHSLLASCVRISIGTEEQNEILLAAIREIYA